MKPEGYRNVRILSHPTPYQSNAEYVAGSHAGAGILPTGRVVWIPDDSVIHASGSRVAVFAEDLGLIFLDPQSYLAVQYTGSQA